MESLVTAPEVADPALDGSVPYPLVADTRLSAAEASGIGTVTAASLGPLQWAMYAFERAQATRVATGEQLRAVLQGRNAKWAADAGPVAHEVDAAVVEATLTSVRRGEGDGPVALLGAAYRRHWQEEQYMLRTLNALVTEHPTWPWIARVRGFGPTLSARLLSRLRIERAATPSAFWAYCGLGTVPARHYACDVCGTTMTRSAPPTTPHRARNRTVACGGTLRPVPLAPGAPAVRAAPSRPRRGERAGYNPVARVACYLLGVSILRRGGRYREYYRERRAALDVSRPEWTAMHRHRAALRAMEKLVLAHLWIVWREAVAQPLILPSATAGTSRLATDHTTSRGPWDMTDT